MANFLSRLFGASASARAREEKASRAAATLTLHSIGAPQWTARNNVALTRAGYERNAVCYRAVRMVAEGCASIPWLAYEGRVESPEHPLLRLIERPNPSDTSVSFIEALVSNLLLYGNAYVEGAFVDGLLREAYCLRPDRMSVVAGRNGWPAAYVYSAGGEGVRYETQGRGIEPILHIRLFNPLDDIYGFAPLAAAQTALDTHNAASFWNKALLDNSARPSGALVYAGPDGAHLTDEQFERLKQELEENFSGAVNAGRPLLLEGGLDWKALSLSPKDMDFSETKASAAREIALAFGVPPLLIGLPGDNTFRNYEEANRAFWRQTIIPLVRRLQKAFHAWAQPGFAPFRLDYDADRIDALAKERALEWSRIGGAAFLTVDEQREAAGYGPMGGHAKYSRDQPRVSAGSPEGGQWTSGDGSGGDLAQVALNTIAGVVSDAGGLVTQIADSIDLRDEEANGGHAISEHVGKSDEYLIRRLQSMRFQLGLIDLAPRVGSFPSLDAAQKLVNSTIAQNQEIVDLVASGELGVTEAKRINGWFNSPTGKEAYVPSVRGRPEIRDTWGVAVALRHDVTSPRGYRVQSAFPANR
ncbi:phage portal protein [Methylosinus sp. KRF6]|nr:phage portal protein [Methylosinus sp. KRF6]